MTLPSVTSPYPTGTEMRPEKTDSDRESGIDTGYRSVNRHGWDILSRSECDSSVPYGSAEFRYARRYLDGDSWLPWGRLTNVLCLAAGGGQQAPLFAWLGYHVTVVDLSPEQLRRDREVAARHGLSIECVEADMLDLAVLADRHFDLVYQPISACYVPDVRRLYQEVHRVLRPGGLYRVEHWNPVHMQLDDEGSWDDGYRITRPQRSSAPVPWACADADGSSDTASCWHYIHPLKELLGALCDVGFAIRGYRERGGGDPAAPPGTPEHVAEYVPPFFRLLARRLPGAGSRGP
jgi:SAM-dependent methyltransferase